MLKEFTTLMSQPLGYDCLCRYKWQANHSALIAALTELTCEMIELHLLSLLIRYWKEPHPVAGRGACARPKGVVWITFADCVSLS